MTLSVADRIFLVVGVLDIGGILVCMGVVLHMAYTKMEVMLKHMERSSIVVLHAQLRDFGPWGRLILIGWISDAVTFPKNHIRNGRLSIEDFENFPPLLKRKLVATRWIAIFLVIAMFVLSLLRKFGPLK